MTLKLNEEHKVSILLAALEERYRSIHTIRSRVQAVGIWALGILLAISGWVVVTNQPFGFFQKCAYILAITISVAILRFKYLADLHRGFSRQQKVVTRLESALGLYEAGVFDNKSEPMYPKEWEAAGTSMGKGNFFNTTYFILYVVVGLLVASILLKGWLF